MADIIDRKSRYRHGRPGYYCLADLPQRPPIIDSRWSGGWPELDKIFWFYPGQMVVVTGMAGSGKSSLVLNMVCNIARQSGKRSFLYVPENETDIAPKLRSIWNDDSTFDVFAREQCFIQSSFYEPDDPPHTMEWVMQEADHHINKDGIDLIVIDPWNELERAKLPNELMTEYVGKCLMWGKDLVRTYAISMVLVAHPTKSAISNNSGHPHLWDIEHSMNWFNKCDNGLIVVRNAEAGISKLISEKVRHEHAAGSLGAFHYFMDSVTGRVYPRMPYETDNLFPTPAGNSRAGKRGRGA